jgi:hypothetical protein
MHGRHPYFSSPLAWHDRLDEALAEAQSGKKRVLVVHGKQTCGGTRAMVERTLAKEELTEYVLEHFVPLASRGEEIAPEVEALLAAVPKREPTPVCLYLGADGKLLHSTAGGRPPAVLLNDMLEAVSNRSR